jgi:hypothetical protein
VVETAGLFCRCQFKDRAFAAAHAASRSAKAAAAFLIYVRFIVGAML